MNPAGLFHEILKKRSLLCVGLDTDIKRIPAHLLSEPDPVFSFNRAIIEATADLAIAYKPNLAFYEAQGPKGWESLQKTLEIIPKEIMTIADAKRGDIGNTSGLYARAFFETLDFDAVTVAPYMGEDSVKPFLEFRDKWVFLLALTSNAGAKNFQWTETGEGPLYEQVIKSAQHWSEGMPGNLGFVVGATRADEFAHIRNLAPDAFFLVPGVGAQGGDLAAVCEYGLNEIGGLLINSSRGIIYASQGLDFAETARKSALELQNQMSAQLEALL